MPEIKIVYPVVEAAGKALRDLNGKSKYGLKSTGILVPMSRGKTADSLNQLQSTLQSIETVINALCNKTAQYCDNIVNGFQSTDLEAANKLKAISSQLVEERKNLMVGQNRSAATGDVHVAAFEQGVQNQKVVRDIEAILGASSHVQPFRVLSDGWIFLDTALHFLSGTGFEAGKTCMGTAMNPADTVTEARALFTSVPYYQVYYHPHDLYLHEGCVENVMLRNV